MAGWVSERDLQADGVRLFCLPHAGSGAAGYYRWKRIVRQEIAVCPVHLPGREGRMGEVLLRRVGEVVDGLQEAVRGELERPYAIFGHSMGALIAFEWARRIEADGLRGPVRLFCSGRNAPGEAFWKPGLHLEDDAGFTEALHGRFGGMPVGFLEDPEIRATFLPVLRADLEMVEMHERPPLGERLRCAVSGFFGEGDGSVSVSGMKDWGGWTGGEFEVREFAGDHFYHFGAGQRELVGVIGEEVLDPKTRADAGSLRE